MSNGLTADWDLMQAINVSTVNAAIAAELKAADNAFPTSFEASVVYPGAGVTVNLSGSFSSWSIQSGSGQNITFQASLAFAAASMTQNGQTQPISLAPYQGYSLSALIMIDQLYYQAQGNAQALQLAPKTQVLTAVINGTPASGASTTAQPISDIDFDNGGHLQDAFTNWCQSSLTAELAYAFLVMDESQLTFAWANPTTASYSVNFPPEASDGVFAQYSMTENRIPGNTAPAVESNAVPRGSDGVLCISTDRFLQKVMINALAQQFLNASASDFQAITEPDSTMATGLTNTAELTLPDMQLDSGDIVSATIPAQGVSLSIVGDQVIITIDGLTFECPDIFGIIPSGVYVTLNYSCTANLITSNGALSLSNVNHTLNYSVTYAAAYKWLDIAIGVMTVVFAFVGLASTLQGARSVATTATQDAEVVSGEVSNTATGSITVTGAEEMSANLNELTGSVNSGQELSQDAIQQMDTVITDTNTVARGTGSVSFGYVTRVIFRLILLGGAGYGLYNAVSWNIVGNLVRVLDDGDPVDPPTLEDFSANLLKPVTWTNVKAGWSVAGAAMDDGVQLNLSFTSPG